MSRKLLLGILLGIILVIGYFSIKSWRYTHHLESKTCLSFQRIQVRISSLCPPFGTFADFCFQGLNTIIPFIQRFYNITNDDINLSGSCYDISERFYNTSLACNNWIYRENNLSEPEKRKKNLQCILEYTENNTIIDSKKVSSILQGQSIQQDQQRNESILDQSCKKELSDQAKKDILCLQEVQKKALVQMDPYTGFNIYEARDKCFSYNDTIDRSDKNPCVSVVRRSEVLHNICREYARRQLIFDRSNITDAALRDLQSSKDFLAQMIVAKQCESTIVLRNESFSELSKELGAGSTYQVCVYETDCPEQELCNRNVTMRCEKSQSRLLSLKELEPIIRDNGFTEMGCGHDGGCAITTISGVSYSYKHSLSNGVADLLKKYNKTNIKERTE